MELHSRIRLRTEYARPLLAVDYRGLGSAQALLALLEAQLQAERACTDGVLVFADFRQTRLSADFIARAKIGGVARKARVVKTAILCTTELHHILLQEYIFATGDHAVQSFADEQAALRWLLA